MEILKTTDYSKFKIHPNNRVISQSHVKDFAKKLKIANLLALRPIIVDSEMQIIDGQHRFLACKSEGLPIWYTIKKDATDNDIVLLNATAIAWKAEDYLNYYVKKGFPEYIRLNSYIKRYRLPIRTAFTFIKTTSPEQFLGKESVSPHSFNIFKEGRLTLLPHEDIEACMLYVDQARTWMQTHIAREDVPFLNNVRFLNALIRAFSTPEIDKTKMLEKLKRFGNKLKLCSNASQYYKQLIEIYNMYNHTPVII